MNEWHSVWSTCCNVFKRRIFIVHNSQSYFSLKYRNYRTLQCAAFTLSYWRSGSFFCMPTPLFSTQTLLLFFLEIHRLSIHSPQLPFLCLHSMLLRHSILLSRFLNVALNLEILFFKVKWYVCKCKCTQTPVQFVVMCAGSDAFKVSIARNTCLVQQFVRELSGGWVVIVVGCLCRVLTGLYWHTFRVLLRRGGIRASIARDCSISHRTGSYGNFIFLGWYDNLPLYCIYFTWKYWIMDQNLGLWAWVSHVYRTAGSNILQPRVASHFSFWCAERTSFPLIAGKHKSAQISSPSNFS